jgi:hypothetical protein
MNNALTPLEFAIIQLVADQNWPNFRVGELEVTSREFTGVGCYTHFRDLAEQKLVDGSYGAGLHFVEMEGVPNGLFFVVEVDRSRIAYLEVVSAGDDTWDGVERTWKIT